MSETMQQPTRPESCHVCGEPSPGHQPAYHVVAAYHYPVSRTKSEGEKIQVCVAEGGSIVWPCPAVRLAADRML